MRKYTYEQVKKMFEDAGCILVSKEYKNSSTPLEYYCSCDNTIIETIKLNSFMMGCRCHKCRSKRINETMMKRYGVTHLTQIPEKKEQMTRKIRNYVENKKHTLEDLKKYFEKEGCVLLSTKYTDNKGELDVQFKCGCIGKITFNKFQSGHRCSNNECMTFKKKETSIELFRQEWYAQTKECQQKIKETCIEKYNASHPMQDPTIHEKSHKNAHSLKKYEFPSGRTVNVQGYEPFALNDLLEIYNENDIIIGAKYMPEIWYNGDDGKYHKYFPDIYIPKDNLLIEVKSTFTLNKHRQKVINTRKTCLYLGFRFQLRLYDEKGNRLNCFHCRNNYSKNSYL